MAKFVAPKSSGNWIGKNEKEVLIADGTALPVVSVRKEANPFEKESTRQVLVVDLDGEEKSISFTYGNVQSRDVFLDSLAEYLNGEDVEPVTVVLTKSGRAILVETVE